MQKNRFSKLSISIKSRGRFNVEKKSNLRSPYQRDRDRIIHSTAFRRLKHKTQVFVNTTGDHYRTRITHSLEVAQIARTLAKYFNDIKLFNSRLYVPKSFWGLDFNCNDNNCLYHWCSPCFSNWWC